MWASGKLEIDCIEVCYKAKHFEEGSRFGIDGGRISKLSVRCALDVKKSSTTSAAGTFVPRDKSLRRRLRNF